MKIRDGLTIEHVGNEILVLDVSSQRVHRLIAEPAEIVRCLERGENAHVGWHSPAMLELIHSEIVEDAEDLSEPDGPTRRQVLAAAAVGTAALGVISVALPPAAAAASGTVPTNQQQLTLPIYYGDGFIYAVWA